MNQEIYRYIRYAEWVLGVSRIPQYTGNILRVQFWLGDAELLEHQCNLHKLVSVLFRSTFEQRLHCDVAGDDNRLLVKSL